MILAIDPGPTKSAYVRWDGERVVSRGIVQNDELLLELGNFPHDGWPHVIIERIASYGMAVGAEVFETCVWTGRFMERCLLNGVPAEQVIRIPRKEICVHLCGSARAKDANIRQALIDRVGAPGKKSAPGPTFGIAADMWAALAVAVTAHDRLKVGMIQ